MRAPHVRSLIHFVFYLVSARDLRVAANAQVPTLKLPWGTYEAQPFPADPNIYLFENVRFGAKPVRFSAPQSPSWTNSSVQPPSDGRNCIQIDPSKLKQPPGGSNPIDDPADANDKTSEDCLFLDLYVPKQVLDKQNPSPAPVVVWIYGGAFAFGSKNQLGPLYNGQSIIEKSLYQTIFVAGNYRVGAYGWLAGDYLQKVGQPNAGLYDQALLFDWVQQHIDKVNGDKTSVSAFGESAGASSILHHLIRENGQRAPAFNRIAVQSPAFEWAWDNSPGGKLDRVYKSFSSLAGCGETFNIECLRSSKNLSSANQVLFNTVRQTGLFPVGPAVDGKWVTTLPTISFSKGSYSKKISSAIISHTLNEAHSFTPEGITSEEKFNAFLAIFLPGDKLTAQRQKIHHQYDCKTKYNGDYTRCIATVIRDASFTCNTRDLFSAYTDKSYMMRYGFPLADYAYHASDLIALFSNTAKEALDLLEKNGLEPWLAKLYADMLVGNNISVAFQTYFASFALSGNPNKLPFPSVPKGPVPEWPIADGSGDEITKVLQVQGPSGQKPFEFQPDDQNSKTVCSFWTTLALEIVSARDLEDKDSTAYGEL
ncbi:hypothetical protein QQS21_008254 [Conoideocrella luteorostrata]|uniref:Carboxylesterase type B domain-containing protein n=1 Tax=Conoideocrella luteorostrata TaxID=1105319 RepID=A0AAJ0CJ61_9HYPO|nr:hypothetical protein QQS21_008254 [Conoideocrella luteorostrata]